MTNKPILSSHSFGDVTDSLVNEFVHITQDIINDEDYQKLENYTHHKYNSRRQHLLNVAWYSYILAKKFNLDYVSIARGALLHDFYLYDRPHDAPISGKHSHIHPLVALENAEKHFEINDIEKDIIAHHMWPVNRVRPKTPEGRLVAHVDKFCATAEWITGVLHLFSERNDSFGS